MIIEVAIAAFVAGIILTIIHLLAVWRGGRFRHLSKPPVSYITGIIALGIPYVILLLQWGDRRGAVTFAVIVIVGGIPVIVGYVAKWVKNLWRENEILRGELKNGGRNRWN